MGGDVVRYKADVTSCDKRFFKSFGLSSDKRNKIAAAYVARIIIIKEFLLDKKNNSTNQHPHHLI